ncbi:hypothetical protein [Sphingobium lignivorans]|uniref:Uncharacterized protein n=2 Tax=Sphingobium TaxID=165695 RepID=A0ABR6NJI3_9SPHN|nr:hypothetical protein [Sphingobium lignivorans]MBB5987449.1 hypothetical protein [Sphingobium lignivorans]
MKWIEPVVSVLGLASMTSSSNLVAGPTIIRPTTSTTIGALNGKSTDKTAAPRSSPGTKLGINLAALGYYENGRTFMNLMAGSPWTLINAQGKWVGMPKDRLDANKNVVRLEGTEQAARQLNLPTAAYRGLSVDIKCTWQGSGSLKMFGGVVKNVKFSGKSLTYTFVPKGTDWATLIITKVDPSDPLRAIDCREKDADPKALFDPTFVADLKRYSTVRYLKWTRGVESNVKVTWDSRTKPGDGLIYDSDGVAIEHIVALSNETRTNPWLTIPWNADEDYVRRLATYVRDNLDPGLVVYVENANEVWNWLYAVTHQARDEGVARGLATNENQAMLRRYAEKTGEVMDIWSSVYAGKMSRLVRVVATQNAIPWSTSQVLAFKDTAKKVDALATAPYFAATPKAGALSTAAAFNNFMDVKLAETVDDRLELAKQNRDIAKQYGLRYIAYEAGQHILSADDIPQLIKVQRDPRMGKLYTRYLTKWNNEIGDLIMLFSNYGSIGQYGAWGMQEYMGQPLNQAPKANAVELFRQSYVK